MNPRKYLEKLMQASATKKPKPSQIESEDVAYYHGEAWQPSSYMEGRQETPTQIPISSDKHFGLISYRGIARQVENCKIKNNEGENDCLAFNLEQIVDEQSNPVEEIPLKIIDRKIPRNLIKNGDNISVIGHRNEVGLFVPKSIINISTKKEINPTKLDSSDQPTLIESDHEAWGSSSGVAYNNSNQAQLPSSEKGDFRSIQGFARYVNRNTIKGGQGQADEEYVSFRLERVDYLGNIIDQIPVELRAPQKMPGKSINNGDKVIVKGGRFEKGILIPEIIYNITTNSEIAIKGGDSLRQTIIQGAQMGSTLFGMFLAFGVMIAGAIIGISVNPIGYALILIGFVMFGILGVIASKKQIS